MNRSSPASRPQVLAGVQSILLQAGYDVSASEDGIWEIRDPESQVLIHAVLEGEVLYFSLPCLTTSRERVSAAMMQKMLAADNGISTSFFQLYPADADRYVITLNNFCKLQELRADDTDDIISCIEFLLADILEARGLLGHLVGDSA